MALVLLRKKPFDVILDRISCVAFERESAANTIICLRECSDQSNQMKKLKEANSKVQVVANEERLQRFQK